MSRLDELLNKQKHGILSNQEKLELIQEGYNQDMYGQPEQFSQIKGQLPLQTDTMADRQKAYQAMQQYENNPVSTTQDKINAQDSAMAMKSDQQRQRENDQAASLANEFSQPSQDDDQKQAKIQALQRLRQGR